MPELPDLSNYIVALKAQMVGEQIFEIRISNPFILRSVTPSVEALTGRQVTDVSRLGKRIIIGLTDEYYIAIHLMIAGRFRWYKAGAKIPRKQGLMAFDLAGGTLILTEVGQKRRASVHLVQGLDQLKLFDPGGADVFNCDLETFKAFMTRENHTIKRSMTDQKFLSGIGNAYSDEILHHACISAMRQTRFFTEEQWQSLYDSCRLVLRLWVDKLRKETGINSLKRSLPFTRIWPCTASTKPPTPIVENPCSESALPVTNVIIVLNARIKATCWLIDACRGC